MRIEKIHLENFRGFKDETMDLEVDFTALVGNNGPEKTTIFDAASIALGGLLSESLLDRVKAMLKLKRLNNNGHKLLSTK